MTTETNTQAPADELELFRELLNLQTSMITDQVMANKDTVLEAITTNGSVGLMMGLESDGDNAPMTLMFNEASSEIGYHNPVIASVLKTVIPNYTPEQIQDLKDEFKVYVLDMYEKFNVENINVKFAINDNIHENDAWVTRILLEGSTISLGTQPEEMEKIIRKLSAGYIASEEFFIMKYEIDEVEPVVEPVE